MCVYWRSYCIAWNSHQDNGVKGLILFMLKHGYFMSDYDNFVYFRKLLDGLYVLVIVYWWHIDCLQEHVWHQQFKELVEWRV